ncbi:methyltransferase [Pleionea sp. CnH1-48]|uniref:class I SAM-dependent methyltransferase n=1 Tax=Pleionea sp. CnH1-48 TaxID=2954494 RepID=UPI002096EE61|nr:methyltransferase domain-containing protein [Pleionea sp. CnH1-48]MCO7224083.1 methyltransferase domain-containing protein [Pleionea sp. CnH1-48]
MPELIEVPEENLFYAYDVLLMETKHRLVKKLKKYYEPNVHGHKTWSSSFLLMDYFLHNNVMKRSSKVLELGCGWGAASIFCAKKGAKVSGLDIDENVFPYLEVQATMNGVEITPIQKGYEKLKGKELGEYNILIGADICFWDELTELLVKLIRRAMRNGVKRVIIADPGRSPFLDLVESCKSFAKVSVHEWYSSDPEMYEGYIADIKAI